MKKQQGKPVRGDLRQKAETILKKSKKDFFNDTDNLRIIQELSVHQIELELQNEELIESRFAEKAIADKYTQLYDFAPSGYFSLDHDGKITELNFCAAKMLGRERGKLIKASFAFFLEPECRPIFRDFLSKVLENNFSQTCEVVLESGMRLHLTGVCDNDTVPLTAIDITHLKQVESDNRKLLDDLLQARKKLELALENASIGNWDWDRKTGLMTVDSLLAEMFGLGRDKKTIAFSDFEGIILSDDIPKIRRDFREAIENETPLESIFRIKDKEEKVNYLSAKAFINYDPDHKPLGLTGVCIDTTRIYESSERALIKLNTDLSQSNKELQNFAYIASHDLQEPLRMVTSFVQLLEKQYGEILDEKAHEYINFAVQGAKRMYELLNSLLTYSRIRTRENAYEEIDMNDLVKKVMDNLQIIINEKNVRIEVKELPTIMADGNQMIQLFQNLIDNSIKFSKKNPFITISAKRDHDFYTFSVKDRGIGINPEYFERIFRIFQRLHTVEEYSGTGVGLAICKSIVERHGGKIWPESAPGKGTTFFFTLPINPPDKLV